MLASPPIRRRPARSLLTPTRITTAILFALLVLTIVAIPSTGTSLLMGGYLLLVLATVIVMRGVRRDAVGWLGQRAVRRGLVVLLLAVCVALALSPAPTAASGPGSMFVLFLILVGLNIALGRATQRIATAPDAMVDERQEQLRNRAHRLAYAILVVTVGGIALVADVASSQSRAWLQGSLGGGGLIAFLELLFVLPAMVMAFLDRAPIPPDGADAVDRVRSSARARLAAALLAATIALPLLLSLAVVVLPPSVSSHSAVPADAGAPLTSTGSSVHAAQCREFFAMSNTGLGLGAQTPLHARVCWNGTRAYEDFGMNASDCMFGSSSVLATSPTTLCRRTTGPDGTLSFTYSSQVTPLLLPFLHRDVTLQLVIDRNGKVERFP